MLQKLTIGKGIDCKIIVNLLLNIVTWRKAVKNKLISFRTIKSKTHIAMKSILITFFERLENLTNEMFLSYKYLSFNYSHCSDITLTE